MITNSRGLLVGWQVIGTMPNGTKIREAYRNRDDALEVFDTLRSGTIYDVLVNGTRKILFRRRTASPFALALK